MVCPSCSLDNDPSSAFCARCNTALSGPGVSYSGPVPVGPEVADPNVALYPDAPISQAPQVFYPAASAPPQRRSAAAWPFAALGIAVVAASTILAVVKLTGGDSAVPTGPRSTSAATTTEPAQPATVTTAPAPPLNAQSARGQAAAVDAVLDASVTSRRKLNSAIDRVGQCTDLDGAVADMRTVGQERQAQLNSVGGFDLSALSSGEQVRSMLREALQYSLDADRSFTAWAEGAQANGCRSSGQRSAAYAEAQRLSSLAGQSKGRFLGVWNPLAGEQGLQPRSPDDI
jgi:hypothetical protein